MTQIDSLSPAKRALLERTLRERRKTSGAAAIPRRAGTEPAPLSSSQQRMWFLQRWEPDSPAFNGARALRLRGELALGALIDALREIVSRHESLRTVAVGDAEPVQMVLEEWQLEVPTINLAQLPSAEREVQLKDLLRSLAREPFDLAADLMIRATIIKLGAADHVLLLRMHHIAADAHSDSVLFAELSELYAAGRQGHPVRLPELPIQYSDYAVWERERLRGPRLDELVGYWAQELEGAPELLGLATDHPRPEVQRHEGSHYRFSLPRATVQPLLDMARARGVTFYMAMLGVFATLLYRISGESDIVIGSPIANRLQVELQDLIGFFTNTIALRIRLDGNPSFAEVLDRAKATATGAYAHQDLPFEKVVEVLRPRRNPAYNPVFQVNFRAQAGRRPLPSLEGLEIEALTVDIGFSRFDLALEFELGEDELAGYFEYNLDLFEESTAAELVEDLRALLESLAADPTVAVLEPRLPHGRRRGPRHSGSRAIMRRLPK